MSKYKYLLSVLSHQLFILKNLQTKLEVKHQVHHQKYLKQILLTYILVYAKD